MENPGQTADRRRDAEALLAHTGWMRSLALQLVRDSAGAEDLVQDTLVAALERRAAAGPGLGAWLSGVLRNIARGRFRSAGRRRRRELLAARPEVVPSAADIVERADLHRRIVDAVLRLEEPYASAVLLRYFDGLRPVDIARAKGVPESTVRTWLGRGMEKLRRSLQPTDAHGREAWLSGLIVFAGLPPPESPAGMAAGSSIAAGGTAVKVNIVLAACLVACAVLLVTGVVSIGNPDAGARRQDDRERLETADLDRARQEAEEAKGERDRLRERVAELEAHLRAREETGVTKAEAAAPEEAEALPPVIQAALKSWSALLGDPERVWKQLHEEGDIEKMEEFTSTVGTLIPWKLANEELSNDERVKLERLLDLNGFREGYVKFAKGDFESAQTALGKHIESLYDKEAELARAGRTLDGVLSVYRERSKDVLRFLLERAGRPPAAELDLGEGWITEKRIFLAESRGKIVAVLFRGAGDKRAAPFLTELSRHLEGKAGVEMVTLGYFTGRETLDEARTKLKEDLAAIGYEGPAGVEPDSTGHALFRSWQAMVGSASFMIVDREGRLAWYMTDPKGSDVKLVSRILDRIAGGR